MIAGEGESGRLRLAESPAAVGYATIRFIIATDGSVANVVVEDATDPRFGEAAKVAVRGRKYSPGSIGGTPVAVRMTQFFSFP
jgi:TonB family protein